MQKFLFAFFSYRLSTSGVFSQVQCLTSGSLYFLSITSPQLYSETQYSIKEISGFQKLNILKGIVHPKVYEDILKNVGNQTLADSHWLPWFFLSILWLWMATSNCLFSNILQNIFFVFNRKKRNSNRFGFQVRVSKWWNRHFWMNCLFKDAHSF